jgi:hypothetical protein
VCSITWNASRVNTIQVTVHKKRELERVWYGMLKNSKVQLKTNKRVFLTGVTCPNQEHLIDITARHF